MKSALLGILLVLFVLAPPAFAATSFSEVVTGLPTDAGYTVSAADFDADGLMDVIMFGPAGAASDAVLYRNTNGVRFAQAPLPPNTNPGTWPKIFWGDDNGDGLLDFIMTRANDSGGPSARIYIQNADHTFTQRDPHVDGEVAGWMDLDNDGRLDIIVSPSNGVSSTTIYWKEADGTYPTTTVVTGRFVLAGDLDNDGDTDLVCVAPTTIKTSQGQSVVIRNDLGRRFTDSGVSGNYSFAVDLNDDGKLDLVGTSNSGSVAFPSGENLETDIDFNKGGLNFQRVLAVGPQNYYIVMDAADYDGDGLADLMYFTSYEASGFSPYLVPNHGGAFTNSGATFTAAANDVSSIVAADFDGDGDRDFLPNPRGANTRKLLQNSFNVTRIVSTPANLASDVRRDRVDFLWEPSDPHATTFNLRVGTSPGANDILASCSAPNGRRLLQQMGNAGAGTSWHLDRLKPGTYFWSVQAVDWGFRGSEFAPEQSFTVAEAGPLPDAPTISAIDNVVIDEDTSIEIPFSIGPEARLDELTITAESSLQSLIPVPALTVSGAGTNRVLRIETAPNASGIATITLRVTDVFGQSATASFFVSVLPVNDPPEISQIADQLVYAGAPDLNLSFTVTDLETLFTGRTSPFVVTATSSDTNLISNGSLRVASPVLPPYPSTQFGLTIKVPLTKTGSTTITLSTTDGQARTSMSFVVTVAAPPFRDAGIRFGPATPVAPIIADFDNDGRLDVLTGAGPSLSVFRNTADGFVEAITNIHNATYIVADFNNDNYVDLFSIGTDAVTLYLNQKGTNFTLVNLPMITPMYAPHIEAADLDNDGDLDLMILGTSFSDLTTPVVREYLNEGGAWRSIAPPFPLMSGNFALYDFNNDGILDCMFSGTRGAGIVTNCIMLGIGGGRFTLKPGSEGTVPQNFGHLSDIDSDGAIDLWVTSNLQTGFYRYSDDAFHYIGAFTNQTTSTQSPSGGPTRVVVTGYLRATGDLNQDGQIDLVYGPIDNSTTILGGRYNLLLNTGPLEFTSIGNPLYALSAGPIAVADFNNDGRADILGQPTNNVGFMILTNVASLANSLPGVPTNLRAEQIGQTLKLSWDAADDFNQPAGLTYNVRVGTSSNAFDVVSPLSLANGRRLLLRDGNAGNRLSLLLTNLNKDKYFWSVQAVDNSFAGGAFAPEQTAYFNLPTNLPPIVQINPTEYVGGEDTNGIVTLTITDDDTPAGQVHLRVYANDPGLLPFTSITVTGTDTVRIVRFKPVANKFGQTELVIEASDAAGASVTNFVSLTFTNINDAPVISAIPNLFSDGPTDIAVASFQISDVDDAPDTLTLQAGSDRPDLLPDGSIVFGGTGTNRTISLQTPSSEPGIANVTVTVTDPGGLMATQSFSISFTNRVFKVLTNALPAARSGTMAWGDVDNDGDLDLVIADQNGTSTILYLNQGGTFVRSDTILPPMRGVIEWCDVNNDGNLDLFLHGWTTNAFVAILKGDGHGNFSPFTTVGMIGRDGPAELLDFNGDGKMDVFSGGTPKSASSPTIALYLQRNGQFVPQPYAWASFGLPLTTKLGDFNSDGLVDIRLTKATATFYAADDLLVQTPNGLVEERPFWPGQLLLWADFDNDGIPDPIVSTASNGVPGDVVFYKNLGGAVAPTNSLIAAGFTVETITAGDYDGDSLLDLFLSGTIAQDVQQMHLYHNDGNGIFREVAQPFPSGLYQHPAWVDVDNDGNLDFVLGQYPLSGANNTQIFLNNALASNRAVKTPTGLRGQSVREGLLISWEAPPEHGVTFNVAVGTSPGLWDVVSPLSGTNGFRKVVGEGNAGWRRSKIVTGLELGKQYYFTVQAVDNRYIGSPFAEEQSITLEAPPQLTVVPSSTDLQFTLQGQPDREYVVEASTDLKSWIEIKTVKDPTGVNSVTLPAPFDGIRFFRARGDAPAP